MLKITRDKAWVKYVEWNGMEIYCGSTKDDEWVIELCLNSDNKTFCRFTIYDFSLDALQKELDSYFSNKVNCKRLLIGIYHGIYQDETLYPGYVK